MCRSHTCAEPSELTDAGGLPQVLDGGGMTRDGASLTSSDDAMSSVDGAMSMSEAGASGAGGAGGASPDGSVGTGGTGGAIDSGRDAGSDVSVVPDASPDAKVDAAVDSGPSCVPGSDCVYMADPCHKGTTSCASGSAVCQVTTALSSEGTGCGANKYCVGGECKAATQVLSMLSGDLQSGLIDEALPTAVQVKLVDAQGTAVAGATLTVTPSSGAAASISGVTNTSGLATLTLRLGRAAKGYTYRVTSPLSNPVDITATATLPAANTIFTAVNVTGATAAPTNGPGTVSQLNATSGIASEPDGTLYFAGYCVVKKLSPDGALSDFAGTSCGYAGDAGPAKQAKLSSISGIALDVTRRVLYIADTGNNVIRSVDLSDANNPISTYAGGNASAPSPSYGDNGPATAALLSSPGSLSVDADGALYIGDTGHNRVRRVDLADGTIHAWLNQGPGCAVDAVNFSGCGDAHGCSVVWDAQGNAFVSGQICGTSMSYPTSGVVRVSKAGAVLARIVGKYNSGTGTLVPASGISLGSAPSLAMDPAGNLYMTEFSGGGSGGTGYRIRRIESGTGRAVTLSGDGTALPVTSPPTPPASYVDASTVELRAPEYLAFDAAGNLHFVDSYSVRSIVGVAQATAPLATLSIASGNNQSGYVDQASATPLAVKLVDSNAVSLKSGYTVNWKSTDVGGALDVPASDTSATGVSSASAFAGLIPQDYHFTASYSDIHGNPVTGSPAQFTLTAAAPPAGTIFSLVNPFHASDTDPLPGAGTRTHISGLPRGVAVATDGTVYFSTDCSVKKISPAGVVSQVAGTDSCGTNLGDGGPALQSQFYYAKGVALDETNNQLYVADSYNARVRAINLVDHTISTLAGGGASTMVAPFGDGGAPTSAYLSSPTQLSISGDTLYVTDSGHSSIRSVTGLALGGTQISMYLNGVTTQCASAAVILHSCGSNDTSCNIVWDGATAYIAGQICGTGPGYTAGVIKVSGGVTTWLVGKASGSSSDGALATNATLNTIPVLALDANKVLYMAVQSEHRIRKIDTTAGAPTISTVAGTLSSYGGTGDFGLATSALLYNPAGLAVKSGHLLIADANNYSIREVW